MKKLLFISLLFIAFTCEATNYYVSNTGSNASAGTSTGTAWATIAKVNSFSFSSGDSILFKAGGTWNEKLIVPHDNIHFGSYSTGNKPILSSLQTITGFTNTTGNIWTKTVSNACRSLQIVFINGVQCNKGRYPNTGYLNYTTHIGTTHIAKNTSGGFKLLPSPDTSWIGGEAVVRSVHWISNVSKILGQGADTSLEISGTGVAMSGAGNGFIIQNHPKTLDTLGEWCFDSATNLMTVYSVGAPTVKYANLDTLVYMNHRANVSLNSLSFYGANFASVVVDTSSYITIRNCISNYSGGFGFYYLKTNHYYAFNDTILNSMFSGIHGGITGQAIIFCDSGRVSNCYIKNTAKAIGMLNEDWYDKGNGITIYGDSVTVSNNQVDSSGYDAITVLGKNSYIYRNYVNTFCFVLDDGGGIKQGVGAHGHTFIAGSIIRRNIVVNGVGAPAGTFASLNTSAACNIYLDGNSEGVTIDSNTLINGTYAALNFNEPTSMGIYENTISNDRGDGVTVSTFVDTILTSLNMKRNIFLITDYTYYSIRRSGGTDASFSDSNYFIGNSFRLNYQPFITFALNDYPEGSGVHYSSIASFATGGGGDTYSWIKPAGTIGADVSTLYYNPTQSDSTIVLNGGSFVDPKGNIYTGSFVLKPMLSVVLMKYYSAYIKMYH